MTEATSNPELTYGRPSDDEALKLVVAFYCIMEPDRRSEVLALAEKYAKESRVVDGATHYLMFQSAEPHD
ncbi:hypothetical protein [Bradyrhizobium sp.]|uniref:hypothetical protein n=1 Tax=Bradyrhizobium sp. TaxID=376 RepID=UPI0039E4A956